MTFLRKTLALSAVLAVAVALFGAMATTAHAADDEGVGIFWQEQVLFATSVNDPAHIPRIAAAITVTVTDDEATFDGTGADLVPPFDETIIEVVTVEDKLGREAHTAFAVIVSTSPAPLSVDVATIGVLETNDVVDKDALVLSDSVLLGMALAGFAVIGVVMFVLLTVTRTRLFGTMTIQIKEASVSIPRQLSHHGLLAVALVALVAVAVAVAQSSTSGRAGSVGLFTGEALFSIALAGLVLLTLLARRRSRA